MSDDLFGLNIDRLFAEALARVHAAIDARCSRALHFKTRSDGQKRRRQRERSQPLLRSDQFINSLGGW